MPPIPSGPYRPRHVRFVELWEVDGWRVKIYMLTMDGGLPSPMLMHMAKTTAQSRLDLAADQDSHHHGLAVLTVHEGEDGDYVLVDWWSDNSILRHHNYGAPKGSSEMLRQWPGPGACIWEMAITQFERAAWIEHVLSPPDGPDLAGYLAAHLDGPV